MSETTNLLFCSFDLDHINNYKTITTKHYKTSLSNNYKTLQNIFKEKLQNKNYKTFLIPKTTKQK